MTIKKPLGICLTYQAVFYSTNGLTSTVSTVECFYLSVIAVAENCSIKGIKANLTLYFRSSAFSMANSFSAVIEIVANLRGSSAFFS